MNVGRPKPPTHVGTHRRSGLDWEKSTDHWLLYELLNAISEGQPIDSEAAQVLADRVGRVLDGEPIGRVFRLAKRGPKSDPLDSMVGSAIAIAVQIRIDAGALQKTALSEVAQLAGMGYEAVRHVFRHSKPALRLMNLPAFLDVIALKGYSGVDEFLCEVSGLNSRLATEERATADVLAPIPIVVGRAKGRRKPAKSRRRKLTTPR